MGASSTDDTSSFATALTELRRIGFVRVAVGFSVVELVLTFAAGRILGPKGLGVLPNGEGVGVAFGLMWTYLSALRLGRGHSLSRSVIEAFPFALLLASAALGVMILRRR